MKNLFFLIMLNISYTIFAMHGQRADMPSAHQTKSSHVPSDRSRNAWSRQSGEERNKKPDFWSAEAVAERVGRPSLVSKQALLERNRESSFWSAQAVEERERKRQQQERQSGSLWSRRSISEREARSKTESRSASQEPVIAFTRPEHEQTRTLHEILELTDIIGKYRQDQLLKNIQIDKQMDEIMARNSRSHEILVRQLSDQAQEIQTLRQTCDQLNVKLDSVAAMLTAISQQARIIVPHRARVFTPQQFSTEQSAR